MKEIKNKQRIFTFDIIRIYAILLVIWIHTQEQVLLGNSLLYTFGRTAVPLFLMLSGALIIPRKIDFLKFFKDKTLYLYIISVFWFFIYGLINKIYIPNNILTNLHAAFALMLTAKHLWYLAMFVFLYFIMPFLTFAKNISTRDLLILIFGCFVYKWLNIFFGFGWLISDYIIFIAYILFGYVVWDRKLYKRISLKFILPIITATLIIIPIMYSSSFYGQIFRGYDKWWYFSPLIVLLSLQSYILLLKITPTCNTFTYIKTIAQIISSNSFGIYVIHYAVLINIVRYIQNPLLLFISVAIISFILSYIIGKIPILKILVFKN